MPLFEYICIVHGRQRRILNTEPENPVCKICGRAVARKQRGAAASVYEVLDNGIQGRAVTRLADAPRIFKEREVAFDNEYEQMLDEDDIEPFNDDGNLV